MSVSSELPILLYVDVFLAVAALLCLLWSVANKNARRSLLLSWDTPARTGDLHEEILLLVVLVYLFSYAAFEGLVKWLLVGADQTTTLMVAQGGTQLVGIVACLVVARRFFEGGALRFLIGQPGRARALLSPANVVLVLLALGLCPVVALGTMEFIRLLSPSYEFSVHPTIHALRDAPRTSAVAFGYWIGAALLAPVAEECFFRGLVQSYLINRFADRWTAILIAALAFGLVHISQIHAVGAVTVLGMILGLAYERNGSLLVPIVIHMLFNIRTLAWEAIRGNGM